MISKLKETDMDQVLEIWLETSIKSHNFIKREFWESKLEDMRNLYLPASETYVYVENGEIKGFFSLVDETLAAIFVASASQGRGIGKKLIAKAKELRSSLNLTVYSKNTKSINFYKSCGFDIIRKQTDENTGEPEYLMAYQMK